MISILDTWKSDSSKKKIIKKIIKTSTRQQKLVVVTQFTYISIQLHPKLVSDVI